MASNFEIFSKIQPHEYLKKYLNEKVRPDGRVLQQFRKTMITKNTISTANASAMVRLGGTTVVCGIRAEVCEPKVDTPNQGYLVPNVELSPLCSSKFKLAHLLKKHKLYQSLFTNCFQNQMYSLWKVYVLKKERLFGYCTRILYA
ncbi:unnamed protein product [Rhizopus stolonifer]